MFSKTTYFDHLIKVLLLYKKHALNEKLFCNLLTEFVNSHSIDINLGDFNISLYEVNTRLLHILYGMTRLFEIQHICQDLF